MTIRCKMRLDDVIANTWGGRKAFFSCSYDEKLAKEDAGFQMATPSGHAEYVIDNPKATAQLVIGAYYYVDFTPVPAPPAKPDPAVADPVKPG